MNDKEIQERIAGLNSAINQQCRARTNPSRQYQVGIISGLLDENDPVFDDRDAAEAYATQRSENDTDETCYGICDHESGECIAIIYNGWMYT